jgi:outer membrane protein OmpA-like peptidoglycan-associated protein
MEGHPLAEATVAAEITETEPWSAPDPHRLAGEDAPIWLATGFAVVGTLIAIASASAWLSAPLAVTAQAPPVAAIPAAELDRVAQDTSLQRSAAAQETPPASTSPQAPAAATPEPASEAAKQQLTQRAVSAPQDCFSAVNIPFARNSARPNTKGLEQSIELLRRRLSEHPEATLLVEGHTDTTGTERYNVFLSFLRAKAVAALLGRMEIPERRMMVRAAGASEAKAADPASDRRTLLRIEGVEDCNGATEKR